MHDMYINKLFKMELIHNVCTSKTLNLCSVVNNGKKEG